MSYTLLMIRRAQKELARLPRSDFEKMRTSLEGLADTPRPMGCKKLVDRDGWRIRSGNYRAIYEINDDEQTVTILHIGDRKDIY